MNFAPLLARLPALIARRLWIDLQTPAVNTATQIVEIIKAHLSQEANRMRAADAMMAVDDGLLVAQFLQLPHPRRDFAQRNQDGIRQRHELMLVRLTDVEQSEIIAGRKTFG